MLCHAQSEQWGFLALRMDYIIDDIAACAFKTAGPK